MTEVNKFADVKELERKQWLADLGTLYTTFILTKYSCCTVNSFVKPDSAGPILKCFYVSTIFNWGGGGGYSITLVLMYRPSHALQKMVISLIEWLWVGLILLH